MALSWQVYASERNIPTSIEAIKELYSDGELSRRQAVGLLNHWKAIYSIDDDYFDQTLDDFDFDNY